MKRTLVLAAAVLAVAGCTPTDTAPAPEPSTAGIPTNIGDADPYCILVVDGSLLDNKVSDATAKAEVLLNDSIGNDAGLDAEALNALGDEILTNAKQRDAIYRQLVNLTDDANVASAYQTLITFNEVYGIGVGEAVSQATSFDDYAERARQIQARPEIATLVATLAEDAKIVTDYTGARCQLG